MTRRTMTRTEDPEMRPDTTELHAGGGGAVLQVHFAPTTAPTHGTQRAGTRKRHGYERWVKPVIDRVGAALLLAMLAPLLLVIGAAVLLQLGRPVFLWQDRIGRDGHIFKMLKFRTMEPDRRGDRSEADLDRWDGVERRIRHKVADDPRLVPVGRFLRRWSLDEVPQLFNVLKGDMSLVGPRPELTVIVDRYEPWQHARHVVKPGMTGLWQVTERGNGLMHEHTDVDLTYCRRVTFFGDLGILVLTPVVALGLRKGY